MISASRTPASFFALVRSFTTKTSPISDTNRMIAVRAHGRMRLLNGFEARLRLLFTGRKTSLRAYRQAKLREKDTRPKETIANAGRLNARGPAPLQFNRTYTDSRLRPSCDPPIITGP